MDAYVNAPAAIAARAPEPMSRIPAFLRISSYRGQQRKRKHAHLQTQCQYRLCRTDGLARRRRTARNAICTQVTACVAAAACCGAFGKSAVASAYTRYHGRGLLRRRDGTLHERFSAGRLTRTQKVAHKSDGCDQALVSIRSTR